VIGIAILRNANYETPAPLIVILAGSSGKIENGIGLPAKRLRYSCLICAKKSVNLRSCRARRVSFVIAMCFSSMLFTWERTIGHSFSCACGRPELQPRSILFWEMADGTWLGTPERGAGRRI